MQPKKLVVIEKLYKTVLKPILFKIDPEIVHENMTRSGELLGSNGLTRSITKALFQYKDLNKKTKVAGLEFDSMVGLAAGFDYNAQLTQILPELGFGFGTVGTITNSPYEGNARPLLGRLPKSQSLMVNKGFKNKGAKAIAEKLSKLSFTYPVGISIGQTNSENIATHTQSIEDIMSAFVIFENKNVKNSYYELNISCPNLKHSASFYDAKPLSELLAAVNSLHLTKPVFIKMPIEKTNEEVLIMVEEIVKQNLSGIVIGNLQKNKLDPSLHQDDVKKFDRGYFSGKPTWDRSNQLIKEVHEKYPTLPIIGCGGIFTPEDAKIKIELGASLLQMITGMIFEGPQRISQINYYLAHQSDR